LTQRLDSIAIIAEEVDNVGFKAGQIFVAQLPGLISGALALARRSGDAKVVNYLDIVPQRPEVGRNNVAIDAEHAHLCYTIHPSTRAIKMSATAALVLI
jgi:hypothetical protein